MTDLLRIKPKKFASTQKVENAFGKLEMAIARVAMFNHKVSNVPLSIQTDASDVAVGAVLQQQVHGRWQPLAFFSKRLQPTESRYSTFDSELLGIYLAIKHFRYQVESREFTVFTYHKPLVHALGTITDPQSPREARHFEYIAQSTADVHHVAGNKNTAADALSRIGAFTQRISVDLEAIVNDQVGTKN